MCIYSITVITKLKSERKIHSITIYRRSLKNQKRGEFVQPLEKVFVVGKIDSHWDDDFMQFSVPLIDASKICNSNHQKFNPLFIIYSEFCYSFKVINMIFSRFIRSEQQISSYHQNLPNNPQ